MRKFGGKEVNGMDAVDLEDIRKHLEEAKNQRGTADFFDPEDIIIWAGGYGPGYAPA
jgi:hypothetical protein